MNARTRQIVALAVFLLICYAAAGIGSLLTGPQPSPWYDGLQKPDFNPPSWVFGPVWTALYGMMGVAAWLVWRRRPTAGRAANVALALFAVQLVLNVAWPPLFFRAHLLGVAFFELLGLCVAVGATTAAFFRVSRPAGALMIPYLCWVAFAATLNGAIWSLNA